MDKLGRKEPMSEIFNPNELRIKIAETLIFQSADIKEICLYCFRPRNRSPADETCAMCHRFSHGKCLEESKETVGNKINSNLISENICVRCIKYYLNVLTKKKKIF